MVDHRKFNGRPPIYDEPMKGLSTLVPRSVFDALGLAAKEEGRSRAAVVRDILIANFGVNVKLKTPVRTFAATSSSWTVEGRLDAIDRRLDRIESGELVDPFEQLETP